MKKKETGENLPEYMLSCVTLLYLIVMLGMFPFFFRNRYFDIVSAKKEFFQGTTVVLLAFTGVFGILAAWKKHTKWKITRDIYFVDVWVILFLLSVVVSCILSPWGREAFWGNEGRQLGGAFLLLCGGAYFTVSRWYRASGTLLWVFVLANCGIWLMIICDFWGLDVFYMKKNLPEQYLTYFTGTMGNINMNAEYSGVIAVLMMGFFYRCEEQLSKICFWGTSAAGVYACFCTRSDSWLLAVGGGLLALLLFSLEEGRLSRWREILSSFFCGAVGMKLTVAVSQWTGWENIYIQDLKEQELLLRILDEKVLLVLAVVLLLGYAVEKSHRLNESRYSEFLQKQGIWVLLAVAATGALMAAISIVPLEDSFGSNRGYIWKRTILNFRESHLLQKLFGCGPNCFLPFMEEKYGAEMRRLFVSPFADAHNEFLQFLTVAGIFGAASYMGIQISVFVSCLKRRRQEAISILGCAGVAAYMLQALVNNPSVIITPLYFIFLGIIRSKIGKKSE